MSVEDRSRLGKTVHYILVLDKSLWPYLHMTSKIKVHIL